MSSSSYAVLASAIFVSSPVSLALFQLGSLVRARVSRPQTGTHAVCPEWGAQASRPRSSHSHCMSVPFCYVTSHSASTHSHSLVHNLSWTAASSNAPPFRRHQLLICLCHAMCLKHCTVLHWITVSQAGAQCGTCLQDLTVPSLPGQSFPSSCLTAGSEVFLYFQGTSAPTYPVTI